MSGGMEPCKKFSLVSTAEEEQLVWAEPLVANWVAKNILNSSGRKPSYEFQIFKACGCSVRGLYPTRLAHPRPERGESPGRRTLDILYIVIQWDL